MLMREMQDVHTLVLRFGGGGIELVSSGQVLGGMSLDVRDGS